MDVDRGVCKTGEEHQIPMQSLLVPISMKTIKLSRIGPLGDCYERQKGREGGRERGREGGREGGRARKRVTRNPS